MYIHVAGAAAIIALERWPIGTMPVLRDEARDRTIPESSIIIEYLAQHYPGKMQLVPTDADLARQMRFRDRFYDLYVKEPRQKIVTDGLRPVGKNDPHGLEHAKGLLQARGSKGVPHVQSGQDPGGQDLRSRKPDGTCELQIPRDR